MRTQVDRFLTRPRFQTALLSMFAFTGLVLAGIGLYGLISFLVAERTREIGVRMALGATQGDVVRLVISSGVLWTAAGAVIGIAASRSLSRLLQGLLYEVQPMDIRVFAGASATLVTVAILAAWFPARRAARVDPMIALRND
jgi:ABC-type antimicrobial peptide transport system permease subunit